MYEPLWAIGLHVIVLWNFVLLGRLMERNLQHIRYGYFFTCYMLLGTALIAASAADGLVHDKAIVYELLRVYFVGPYQMGALWLFGLDYLYHKSDFIWFYCVGCLCAIFFH